MITASQENTPSNLGFVWWACVDLNHGPPGYQPDALTN